MHLLSWFNVIKTAIPSNPCQDQPNLESNNDELNKSLDIKSNFFSHSSLKEKQCDFINYLCWNVSNDIDELAKSAKISEEFKNHYKESYGEDELDGFGDAYLKTEVLYKSHLDEDIVKVIKDYFESDNIASVENIMKKHFDLLIGDIKSINSSIELLQNIVSMLENINKKPDQNNKDKLKNLHEVCSASIKQLDDVFNRELPDFKNMIIMAKKTNSNDFEKFKENVSEMFKSFYDIFWKIVVEYEEHIANFELNKCFSTKDDQLEKAHPMSFAKYLYRIHYLELDTLTVFTSRQFKLIGENVNEHCSWSNEVFQKNDERIWLNIFKYCEEQLKKDLENIETNMSDLRSKISSLEEKSTNSVQVDKLKNLGKRENIILDENIIKLFRINMRSLIVVKIIINTVEYFEIYHKSYLSNKNIKPFKDLTIKDIPKDNEQIDIIKKKIKADNNLQDLKEEEELRLYRYISYQNYKKTCFASKNKIFSILNSLNIVFKQTENKILDFYIEFLCDNSDNEENKKLINDMLTLEYKEEYLELAKIIEEHSKFPFLRLPTKLKKLVN